MAVRSMFRAMGILSCGLLLQGVAAAGGVHRCEAANGSVTYSDTGCLSEHRDRGRVDTPTAERAAQSTETTSASDELDASDELEWTHARAAREYAQRRHAFIDELDGLDLGPKQEWKQLLETRARHEFLVRSLARLDTHWREYRTAMGEGAERATKSHLREFEQLLAGLQRWYSNAIDYTEIDVGNQTYTCQWARGKVSCW